MSQYRILFVCTANICRSPTAELLARHRYGEQLALFRSAGFLDSGQTVPSDLESVLGGRGVSTAGHRSSRIDSDTSNAADLILTMEGRHIQELTVQNPPALVKAVPLREAASMLDRGDSLEGLLEQLENRDPSAYLTTKWDIDDPYGRGKRRYRKMVSEVDELLEAVLPSLLA